MHKRLRNARITWICRSIPRFRKSTWTRSFSRRLQFPVTLNRHRLQPCVEHGCDIVGRVFVAPFALCNHAALLVIERAAHAHHRGAYILGRAKRQYLLSAYLTPKCDASFVLLCE